MIIGVLGAGQLGRMLALAGIPLGFTFVFYDRAVAPCAATLGRVYRNFASFAKAADIYTYEFENVPLSLAAQLADAQGLSPSYMALKTAADRRKEKRLFASLDIPTARWQEVRDATGLRMAAATLGFPFILKTATLGYDGRGQWRIRQQQDLQQVERALFTSQTSQQSYIAEEQVQLKRELSIIAVRSKDGEVLFYPAIENVHKAGILYSSRAPARLSTSYRDGLEAWVTAVMRKLAYVGVMTLEAFDTSGGLLANEIAPRVHNSGHWTIEGAACSQFTNHILAISGLPLGGTQVLGFSTMLNLVGRMPNTMEKKKMLQLPRAYLHSYDKEARQGRKLGHYTVVAKTRARNEELMARVTPHNFFMLNGDPKE